MASHKATKDGGIITFDENDFGNGLVPQGTFGSSNIKQTKYQGMGSLQGIDPFRTIGILQPGMGASNATNASAQAGQFLAGVFDPSSNTILYGIDIGGKFHQVNFVTNTITNSGGTFPHTITGTTPIGQDAIIYQHNSGGTDVQVYSVFYSYYNTVNWNVGALVNMTGTPDDNFMSSVPATPLDITSGDGDSVYQRTFPHSMCIGSDDILYIGSGRYIHAYDGATGNNGTFTSRVLTLPAGFQIQGMVKYDDFLYIAGNYATSTISGSLPSAGSSAIYIWDYLSQDITQIIPLNEPYVASMFIWRGSPTVVCYGQIERNGYIKIKRCVGNQAIRVADLPGASNPTPVLRGVDSRQDMLYLNIGGKVITVGNRFSSGGYDINYLTVTSTAQNSGWIYNLQISSTVSGIIACSSNGTTHSFSQFTGGFSAAVAITQYYEPDFPPLKFGRVKSITVFYYQPVTLDVTNTPFSLRLVTDFVQSAVDIITSSQSLTAPIVKKYTVLADQTTFPYFNSVGLHFIWSIGSSSSPATHQVSKVQIEYTNEDYPQN